MRRYFRIRRFASQYTLHPRHGVGIDAAQGLPNAEALDSQGLGPWVRTIIGTPGDVILSFRSHSHPAFHPRWASVPWAISIANLECLVVFHLTFGTRFAALTKATREATVHPLLNFRGRQAPGHQVHRIWIEIVMVATAVACALALLIATLGTVAGAAAGAFRQPPTKPATAEQNYEGMVTCSRCGARHSAKLGRTAADCIRICVHDGARFALVDGDKTYLLEGDLNILKRIAGQRAGIVGVVAGNTIRVSSVSPAK